MTFDVVIIPYSTIPVSVNTISSQNGAINTADESGNNTGKYPVNDVPKLRNPFEFIYIKVKPNMMLQKILTKSYIQIMKVCFPI